MVSTTPKRAGKTPDTESTVRLTVAQATIRFLANQYVERDGERTKFFAGAFGIFGHGNVAGLGQALLQDETLGSQRFGTAYRYRTHDGRLDGAKLPVDLAANAAGLGADVVKVVTAAEFSDAVKGAKASDRTTVIHVETDPLIPAPDSESWWDVPVSEVSTLESTQTAYQTYADWKKIQRPHIRPSDS